MSLPTPSQKRRIPSPTELDKPIRRIPTPTEMDELLDEKKNPVGTTVSTNGLEKPISPSLGELLDPSKALLENAFVNVPTLGEVQINNAIVPFDNTKENAKRYAETLQERINTKTFTPEDVQVVSESKKMKPATIAAFMGNKPQTGAVLYADDVKAEYGQSLRQLVEKANIDLQRQDEYDKVFANPQTISAYVSSLDKLYEEKTRRDIDIEFERHKQGLKERNIDPEMTDQFGSKFDAKEKYNVLLQANNKVANEIKSIFNNDILATVSVDTSKEKEDRIREIAQLTDPNGEAYLAKANAKRDEINSASSASQILFGNNQSEDVTRKFELLNATKGHIELGMSAKISEKITYNKAKIGSLQEQYQDLSNTGALTEEASGEIVKSIGDLTTENDRLLRDYEAPDKIIERNPIILKQQIVSKINEYNALKKNAVAGVENTALALRGVSVEEFLRRKGFDVNDQKVKDALESVETRHLKDYSLFGSPGKAVLNVFKETGKGIGDITGARTEFDRMAEKKEAELFPTYISENDEIQISTLRKGLQNIGNTTGQVVGQALLQRATMGIGRIAGMGQVAASTTGFWTSGAIGTYDQYLKESYDLPINSDVGRVFYAGANSVFAGWTEKFFNEAKILDQIPGVKDAFAQIAGKLSKGEMTEQLGKELLGKAKNSFVNYGEKYATNIAQEDFEEGATSAFNSVSKMLAGDPNMNLERAIEDVKNTVIQTTIGTSFIGGIGARADMIRERNMSAKSTIYNAALYHDDALDAINVGFAEKLYSEKERDSKIQMLSTAREAVKVLNQTEQVSGTTLSRPQKELYVANLTAEALLNEQKKSVTESVLQGKIDEKLSALKEQREAILTNEVKIDDDGNFITPPLPVKEGEKTAEASNAQTDNSKEAESIIDLAVANGKVPDLVIDVIKDDPVKGAQMIADQALGMGRVEGVRQPIAEGQAADKPQYDKAVEQFGKEATDRAIALYPLGETKSEVAKDSGLTSVDQKEIELQMKPFVEKMVEMEIELSNKGIIIDGDYDGEISVTDKKTGGFLAPEDIPEELRPMVAQYEEANMKLSEFDEQSFISAIAKARKTIQGEDAEFEEVKPKQISQPNEEVSNIYNQYNDTGELTFDDMVNQVEDYADENNIPEILNAVDVYRKEQEDDTKLSGRGDMDAAQKALEDVIKKYTVAKPVTTNTETDSKQTFDFSKTPRAEMLNTLVDTKDKSEMQAIQKELQSRTANGEPDLSLPQTSKPVTEYISKNGQTKILFKDGNIVSAVNAKTGKQSDPKTIKRVVKEAAESFDFTNGTRPDYNDMPNGSDVEANEWRVKNTTLPSELAEIFINERPEVPVLTAVEQNIVDSGLKTYYESYTRFGDRNRLSPVMRKAYIIPDAKVQKMTAAQKSGASLDSQAQTASTDEVEVSVQDLVDFMEKYPNGVQQAVEATETPVAQAAMEKFQKLTGLPLNNATAQVAIDQNVKKLSNLEQSLINQEYETRQQIEDAYWKEYSETNGFTKKGDAIETPLSPKSEKSISLKGKELADRIRALRPLRDSAQTTIFAIPIAIYDTGLIIVANAVEGGANLIDAINQAVEYIKSTNPDFDEEGFTQAINNVAEGKKPKIKVQLDGETKEAPKKVSDRNKITQMVNQIGENNADAVLEGVKHRKDVGQEVAVGDVAREDKLLLGLAAEDAINVLGSMKDFYGAKYLQKALQWLQNINKNQSSLDKRLAFGIAIENEINDFNDGMRENTFNIPKMELNRIYAQAQAINALNAREGSKTLNIARTLYSYFENTAAAEGLLTKEQAAEKKAILETLVDYSKLDEAAEQYETGKKGSNSKSTSKDNRKTQPKKKNTTESKLKDILNDLKDKINKLDC